MKLKSLLLIMAVACSLGMQAQKYVGGDLSLVPAYEAAGDKWLDADGNTINSYYDDGMITYVRDVAGWNAVRVRLIVEADKDNVPATCQDLDYVKKLGKRVKDAGMNLLLDIFYSDTWTDVSKQWIPDSWGYNRSTATETLAQKVKSYTTDVLNELTAYGAKPDFVQIGNEVSYGMLWDSASGQNKANAFYTSGSYTQYSSQIERFATLLKAAAEGVRASNCAAAKIVLHCERTYTASHCKNFYTWVQQAGFTDYDIIGLSFYPLWHGTLTNLRNTLSTLQSAFPSKEIHIVETGYQNNTSFTFENGNHNTSAIWPYSPAGQAAFLKDLIAALTDYKNVTGLYYWQPEECGNGADASGNKRVMAEWDNRGFWELKSESSSHHLNSATALMTLKTFISSSSGDDTQTDISSQFNNLDFESCEKSGESITSCPGWTINYEQGWGSIWPVIVNEWHSALADGNCFQAWVAANNSLAAGNIISQSLENMPAGTYTITAKVHTDYNGIYLFANDDAQLVSATSSWGTAYETKVTTTLTETGTITLGLKLNSATPAAGSEINLYADNFKCYSLTSGVEFVSKPIVARGDDACYTLDGRRVSSFEAAPRGIYVVGKKKVVKH